MRKSLDFIHKENYGKAMQVAKKFTNKGSMRPVLTFVNHEKDGSIHATDSHKAVFIKDIHGFDKDYLVHPNTLEFATGNYPDVKDIFEKAKGDSTIVLNKEQLSIWLQMHKSLNQLVRQNYSHREFVTLELKDELTLKIADQNEVAIKLPYEQYNNTLENDKLPRVSYNQAYMRDCLEAHAKLGSSYVEIVINHSFKPILLNGDAQVKSLLQTVRTY